MKWIGQQTYDQISRFRNTVDFSENVTFYQPINDANPSVSIGASDDERLRILVNYQGTTTQTAQIIALNTFTESGVAHDGRFEFGVDGSQILKIQDGGIDFFAGKGIGINGVNILTDNGSGVATLSNIDAIDTTTKNTLEAALTDSTTDSLVIDTDRSVGQGNEGAENITALHVDFDRAVPDEGTNAHNDRGIDLDVTSASLGTSSLYGMDIDVVGTTSGTSTAYGIDLTVSGADTNVGIKVLCEGEQLRLSHNTFDYATFTVADTGDLTIATVGDGAKDTDLILDADGQIKLEPVAGNNILLDGTIAIDAGVVTGATSITSTAFAGQGMTLESTAEGKPLVTLKTTHTTKTSSAELQFLKDAADTEDGEQLGIITFYGENESNTNTKFAHIKASIQESDANAEGGVLRFAVATHDGEMRNGLIINDGNAEDEIDVTIGDTATSLTTIAGTLTMGSTATIDNSGAWVGGVIPSAKLDADTAHLSGVQTFTGDKSFTGTTIFSNSGGGRPVVEIKNTGNNAQGGSFVFKLDKGAAGADDDIPGIIGWIGDDDAQDQVTFGQIYTQVADATNGQEAGAMYLKVAAYDGVLETGIRIKGDTNADGEVDVDIGSGAASVTTVVGTLTMGSTATINNSGVVQVAAQTVIDHDQLANFAAGEHFTQANITTVGTIGTGVWNGTAIAHAYIGDDAIDGDNIADDAVDSEHYTDGSIDTAHIADDQVTFAKAIGVTPNVYGNVIKLIPSDFLSNDDGGNTKFGIGYVETAGAGYGMRVPNNSTELYAFVSIPEGMKATAVVVYDKSDLAVAVFEAQINATTMAALETGNCNTGFTITDTNSTATNFLVIQVTTTSATNDKVYGGAVTIAAQ